MNYNIEKIFDFKYDFSKNQDNTVIGDKYRITIINDQLIRFEYNENNQFTDLPTQMILNRNIGTAEYKVNRQAGILEIETKNLVIRYNEAEFSESGLNVTQKKALDQDTIWYYGKQDKRNLKGTYRTLDQVDGRVEVEDGILSRNGYGILDDSTSLILNRDGSLSQRDSGIDIYYFGYGDEYRQALKDYYQLTGKYPVIPKYMLGNWWSRFWEYDEQEVMRIVKEFEANNIPLSVFIFDMDWHLVDIDEKYGSGWTGFSWNYELFPDPKRIIDWLHKRGIRVALNLHPADGFRAYEEDYQAIACDLGLDPNSGKPIVYDVNNEKFMDSYFRNFIDKNEQLGVDFWWLDWQQGSTSSIENLDPLWMVNHHHYLNHASKHEFGATFSRFAGLASHRYPIGFSGDTHMTWDSLKFQPEFTVTSANIGYNYWSHDIGGHMLGKWDEELYRRWIQFGVFSPIMRLHSGKTCFIEKELWKNSDTTLKVAQKYMGLRERLVDFIQSENIKGSEQGHQLIEPLYYDYPQDEKIYQFKNQYLFGKQLLIAPIVSPKEQSINLSETIVYLPQGTWYDIEGRAFAGNQTYKYYSDEMNYPIFRQQGSIIPLTTKDKVEINIIPGDGSYEFRTEKNIEYNISMKIIGEGQVEIDYSELLELNKEVEIAINPHFIIRKLSNISVGKIVIEFDINDCKYSSRKLKQLVINFDMMTADKIAIEEDKYILDSDASLQNRLIAINSTNLNAKQKEVLMSYILN